MKLLTKEIKDNLKPLYTFENTAPENIPVVAKFFDPWGSYIWYVTEGEEDDNGDWLFFGLVDGQYKELGYFRLSELKSLDHIPARLGLGIERDLHFKGHKLSEVM